MAMLAVLVCVLAASGSAGADPGGDQQQVDRQLARTRAQLEAVSERVEAAAEAYTAATAQLPSAQQHLADARGVVAGAKAHAAAAARAAKAADTDLAVANQALGVAQRRVAETRRTIDQYVVEAYEGGDVAGVSALLSVTSPADFVAGLTYIGHVAQVQQADLDATTRARMVERNGQNVRAARARTADATNQAAADALAKAQTAETAAAQAATRVADLIAAKQAALKVAASERATTLARYKALQAESQRIAAQLRALARTGTSQAIRPGIRLPMPVNGWKSSDFGMRYDPFYKVWQLHAGVDLAAPGGTPIRAAASGRVIQAGWNGGYGNYTCIYHGTYQGKAFATCYAHQSQILVHVGQQVQQGQVIGRVGTTGASTGDHLHFEVRLNGDPVNPLPWLPACLC